MTDYAQFIPRYRRLRKAAIGLNDKLLRALAPGSLNEGARKLDMVVGGTIVLEAESESAILMDYCINDVRSNGLTAAERFLADSPPAPGSDERVMLEALVRSRHSLFEALEVVPGVGLSMRDLLGETEVFVIDLSFSQTVNLGAILAMRLLTQEDFSMSSGAGLPASRNVVANARRHLARLPHLGAGDSKEAAAERSELTAEIIRACRSEGGSQRIEYNRTDLPEGSRARVQIQPAVSGRSPGRNELCPCGSGMKYKKCCGK